MPKAVTAQNSKAMKRNARSAAAKYRRRMKSFTRKFGYK